MTLLNFDLNTENLIDSICQKHGISVNQIYSRSRLPKIVKARVEAIYKLRNDFGLTQVRIAGIFNMHHATIIHALKKYKKSDYVLPENENVKEDTFIESLNKEKKILTARIQLIDNLIKSYNK